MTKYTAIFCGKMRKASHIFSTKNMGSFEILMFEILTKPLLTRLLVLNNRALVFTFHSSVMWCNLVVNIQVFYDVSCLYSMRKECLLSRFRVMYDLKSPG